MKSTACAFSALYLSLFAAASAEPLEFRKLTLDSQFFAEGAAAGDLNRDGNIDVVAGPYWYEGPRYTVRHEIYSPVAFDTLHYSDNFLTFTRDMDGDAWIDVMVFGFPGKEARWYRNPGSEGTLWTSHAALLEVGNESPAFADLTGDGRPEIVCVSGGSFGWAEADWSQPGRLWEFHPIADEAETYGKFTHGLGVHDLNGDGRKDVLHRKGWYEQPNEGPRSPHWPKHEAGFAPERGGAQMLATDLTGDGLPDVITSKNAHGYGISWFEQRRGSGGELIWKEHAILPESPMDQGRGIQFSQPHALALGDMDGDGLQDFVTGKRWWAHGPGKDPEPNAPAVVYVFRQRRSEAGEVVFEPILVDSDSGLGTQVTLADLNQDGRLDIVSSNKKGTFAFLSLGPNRKQDRE